MTDTPSAQNRPPLRAAIVGAGLISDLHIRGVQRLDGAVVAAIVDSDLDRAKAKAAEYGIESVFSDVDVMLERVHPDVVHVLTPPTTHVDICVAALEAGAAVYVEKPMASSEADCDRMIEAARRTGRQLCVGHSLVYDPLMREALEAIEAGQIGEVVHATAIYCFDPKRIAGYNSKGWYRRLGGGFVEDLASHPASVLLRVLGTPRQITGAADPRTAHASHEIAAVVQGEHGTGTLFVSLDARPEDVTLDVRGTRGTVRVNFSTMVVSVQRERGLPKKISHGVRNMAAARDLAVQTVTNTARFLAKRVDTTKGIHTLIAAFYDAVAAGRPAPVPGEDGRDVVRLLRTLWPDDEQTERPARWVLSEPDEAADSDGSDITGVPEGGRTVRHALVTGATGFIGTHLVRLLADHGVRVRAFARDPAKAERLIGPNVEVVIGDFGDPEAIDGLAEGVDTIFHLASVMVGSREEFDRVDLAGTDRLISEAKRAGVERIVFTSTMGAYALAGLADGAVVTEEMTDDPEHVGNYARAKLLIERMLRKEHEAGNFEAVVLRPGLVFGPGTSPYLEHLPHLGNLRGDKYMIWGDGNVPLQLTYVENTVEALWRAATVRDAAGQTFTIIDDELPTQREFVRRLGELTGRPLGVRAVPRSAAWLIGLGVEGLSAALRRRPPTTRRLMTGKTVKLRFDTSRARKVLGWVPRVAWEEGVERGLAWAAARERPRDDTDTPEAGEAGGRAAPDREPHTAGAA